MNMESTNLNIERDEDIKVKVKKKTVKEVAQACREDEEIIEKLLTAIEEARISASTYFRKRPEIPEIFLKETLPLLLDRYPVEYLCRVIHNLKYYQIEEIMSGKEPIYLLDEYG